MGQIHTKCHCRNKNVNKDINQTTAVETDRRTIQGGGTPDTPRNIYKNRIARNPELAKWICDTCEKQYAPRSQQNAIHHACKTLQKKKNQVTTNSTGKNRKHSGET